MFLLPFFYSFLTIISIVMAHKSMICTIHCLPTAASNQPDILMSLVPSLLFVFSLKYKFSLMIRFEMGAIYRGSAPGQDREKCNKNGHLIIHFPKSLKVRKRASEQTNEY